jgi:gluconolactonase
MMYFGTLAGLVALTMVILWTPAPASARQQPAPGVRIERLDPRLDAILAADATVAKILDGQDWTEGPLWDASEGALLFSDAPRNSIFRWKRGEGVSVLLKPSGYTGSAPFAGREPGANGLAFDREGRLVMCQHGDRRIARRNADGTITTLADRYDGRRLNSPNDLTFAKDGSLYFTDPPFGLPRTFQDPAKELPFNGVFRLSPDGKVSAVVTDIPAPNGIVISPDGGTLYVSNAQSQRPVWMAYPLRADGTVGEGRQFAEAGQWVGRGEGVPDGMEADVNGNLFATGPGGVHIYAPDGTRLGRIITGVPTANLAFGDDGSVLYIAANHAVLRVQTQTKGFFPFAR